MHADFLTLGLYLYGLLCTVFGFVVGLAAPRIWRFMNTTFARGA